MIALCLFIAAVTASLAIYQYFLWQSNYWRRRNIPGPPSRLFYGNSKELLSFEHPLPLKLREWTERYGKVYGLQEGVRKLLVISDIEMINEVFVKQFDSFYARPENFLSENVDNNPKVNLFESRGSRWKRLRALASPSFSINSLKKIQPIIEDSAVKMVDLMGEKHAGGASFDVYRYFAEFTLDIICRLVSGQKESTLFENPRFDAFKSASDFFSNSYDCSIQIFLMHLDRLIIHLVNGIPQIAPVLRFIATKLIRTTTRQHVINLLSDIESEVKDRIEKRRTSGVPETPADFIDLFLENEAEIDYKNSGEFSTQAQVTKSITVDEVIAQAFVFLLAGFDTTSNALAYTAWMLSRNPDVMKRCQAELDEVCRDSSISYEDTQKLRYLDAVCRETLRFYPLAARGVSRFSTRATTVGGYDIEKGTTVICDTYSVHFSKELWGDDANEFRPERWLNTEKRVAAINFLTFGAGPRVCIGMRLAMFEEKMALAHLLRRFDIVADEKVSELTLVGCTTISPERVPIKICPRL